MVIIQVRLLNSTCDPSSQTVLRLHADALHPSRDSRWSWTDDRKRVIGRNESIFFSDKRRNQILRFIYRGLSLASSLSFLFPNLSVFAIIRRAYPHILLVSGFTFRVRCVLVNAIERVYSIRVMIDLNADSIHPGLYRSLNNTYNTRSRFDERYIADNRGPDIGVIFGWPINRFSVVKPSIFHLSLISYLSIYIYVTRLHRVIPPSRH